MVRHKVRPVPPGRHTIQAYLTVRGAGRAIEFYEAAFGAELLSAVASPDGKCVVHAELQVGDSVLMLADEFPGSPTRSPKALKAASGAQMMYLPDVDRSFARAVKAGARVETPLVNTFWGDRFGVLRDPFGHIWYLASHIEDVPPGEMMERAEAAQGAATKPRRRKRS